MIKINASCISPNPKDDPQEWAVELLCDGGSKTNFQVTLNNDFYIKLTGGSKSPEELVRASFEFLLERESKESILRSFNLYEIQRYFPEFEKVIPQRLSKHLY